MTDFLQALAAARRTGGLVAPVPRLDLAAGYAVARDLAPHLGHQLGWKIGATSAGAMAFLGVDAPIHGRLFAAWHDGDTAGLPGDRPLEAEPEIIFVLGADLHPVAARFGVELNRPSYADPFAHGTGAIVADNAASLGVLLGPEIPLAALDHPVNLTASLHVDGSEVARGSADAVLENPRNALESLRLSLATDPRGLRPGDLVATGAMCRSVLVTRGQTLRLDAGAHGHATFHIAA